MSSKIPNSWFDDDPEWEMLRRKAENKPIPKKLKLKAAARRPQARIRREEPPRGQAKREDTDKEVVVNVKLAIPKIKLPDFREFLRELYREHKRQIITAGAIAIVAVVAFGAFKLTSNHSGTDVAGVSDSPVEDEAFKPLVPLEGLTDDSGKKVAEPEFKFDKEKKVLGYRSEYNDAQLTISQQALPEQLKIHPGQLEGIARSVNANIPIETQKGRAYLATDDETKTQVAVFATEEVLVFIRSSKELDNDTWIFYINQLNPKS